MITINLAMFAEPRFGLHANHDGRNQMGRSSRMVVMQISSRTRENTTRDKRMFERAVFETRLLWQTLCSKQKLAI